MTPEENQRWWNRQRQIKLASDAQQESNLQWIEARHELESDEFLSARQKAEIIAKGMP